VLRVRCEHFRARCDSGMRDATDSHLPVPEHFSKVRALPEPPAHNIINCP
jgi:hypothetical protein